MSKSIEIWDHFFLLVFPKNSENLESLGIGLWEVGAKRRFSGVTKGEKKLVKKCFRRGNFRPFLREKFQIWDHFFPVLFPKDSESLKILDIRLQEVGAERRLNGTSKVNKWRKKSEEKNHFRRFLSKNIPILDHFFPLLFPQGFWISKYFGHPTLGSGGKKTF